MLKEGVGAEDQYQDPGLDFGDPPLDGMWSILKDSDGSQREVGEKLLEIPNVVETSTSDVLKSSFQKIEAIMSQSTQQRSALLDQICFQYSTLLRQQHSRIEVMGIEMSDLKLQTQMAD